MTAYVTIQYSLILFDKLYTRTINSFFVRHIQERSRIMLRFADLTEKYNDEIAALETWDNGNPFSQATKTEMPMFTRLFRYLVPKVDFTGNEVKDLV